VQYLANYSSNLSFYLGEKQQRHLILGNHVVETLQSYLSLSKQSFEILALKNLNYILVNDVIFDGAVC